ncbi:nucleoporin NUP35-like [Oscarella lobularis]|uniref:nucleoporin NUP35-like n=1 Tax=Oscarella lobularis TaxID=121494 RepID=UPI003313F171
MASKESMFTPSPQSGFTMPRPLPAFLLGTQSPLSDSMTRSPSVGFSSNPTPLNSTDTTSLRRTTQEHSVMTSASKDKGGPPVEGLYDSSSFVSTPFHTGDAPRQQPSFTPSTIHGVHPGSVSSPYGHTFLSGGTGPQSPAQLDPFYQYGDTITSEDQFDDCWVTIFGFPSSATTFVLQEFSKFGSVVKHVISSQGNWMHLKYQSRIQAAKALSKNGKIFGGGIMIGVQSCIDKSAMESSGVIELSSAQGPSSKSGIRPLTAAYRANASMHDVEPREANVPQKNTGFVSKVMEYMLGW